MVGIFVFLAWKLISKYGKYASYDDEVRRTLIYSKMGKIPPLKRSVDRARQPRRKDRKKSKLEEYLLKIC